MAQTSSRIQEKSRCWWCGEDPLYVQYHDREWGRPVRDDLLLFENLLLEGFQAGLSWITVLRKRENYRRAFCNFDPLMISQFTKRDVARLMKDEGIIRNRLKIESAIDNAKAYLRFQETGSFSKLLWSFVGGKTYRDPEGLTKGRVRAISPEAEAMSKALKKLGFRFVGPTICYAHMQATGMVDDHVEGCFRYRQRL